MRIIPPSSLSSSSSSSTSLSTSSSSSLCKRILSRMLHTLNMNVLLAFILGYACCNVFNGMMSQTTPLQNMNLQQTVQAQTQARAQAQAQAQYSYTVPSIDNRLSDSHDNDNTNEGVDGDGDGDNNNHDKNNNNNNEKHSSETIQATDFCSALSAMSSSSSNSSNNNNSNSSNNSSNDDRLFIPSTTSIWSNHLQTIFQSSRHGQDTDYTWHDFTAKLLHLMSSSSSSFMSSLSGMSMPMRLLSSVKGLPKTENQWEHIGELLDVGFRRWTYLQQQNNKSSPSPPTKPPRKINILVMGGSVTMGVQCIANPVSTKTSKFARRDCAWPSRLNQFLNSILGEEYSSNDIISVNVLTLGGTNTDTASSIWDYNLFGDNDNVPFPDIVIHAYATNDMHVLSEVEAKRRGVTLEEMIMEVNQKFVRKVLSPHYEMSSKSSSTSKSTSTSFSKSSSKSTTCAHRPPILLYYDDYIGNEQREILRTNAFATTSNLLSTYYGFGLISYANAVRDIIYADTSENWLSPDGWPERQVHPGMGMHIVSTWVVAFNLLHLAGTFCSMNVTSTNSNSNTSTIESTTTTGAGAGAGASSGNRRMNSKREYVPGNGLPDLKDSSKKLNGEPKMVFSTLPPELNTTLTLDNISQRWEHDDTVAVASNRNRARARAQCNTHDEYPMPRSCTFSWIGGLERRFDKPKHLDQRLKPYLTSNDGWVSSDDNNKLGYVATTAGAKFELQFQNIKSTVRSLNFFVMKSYGEKWEGSMVRVEAFVVVGGGGGEGGGKKEEGGSSIRIDTERGNHHHHDHGIDITGFHDKNTSETYTAQLQLGSVGSGAAVAGDTLIVQVELVGGSTFKITGMAFCNH